jgi:hypothetical protein
MKEWSVSKKNKKKELLSSRHRDEKGDFSTWKRQSNQGAKELNAAVILHEG